MKTRSIIIVGIVVVVAVAVIYGLREYDRPPPSTQDMEVAAGVDAYDLLQAFKDDEAAARRLYVGETEQAIEVTGHIKDIEAAGDKGVNVLLDAGDETASVVCSFDDDRIPEHWAPGEGVTVRCICAGRDEMFGDVVLLRCSTSDNP